MTAPLTAQQEWLRRDTAKLLKYDFDNLSAAESVRLDRAAMLRLELDDCQAKKLAGQPFDMNKYVAASEALERLMGGDPEVPSTELDLEARYQTRVQAEFAGARETLAQLLSDQAERLEAREVRVSEQLRAEIETLKATLAGKDATILALTAPPPELQPPPSSPPPQHWRIYEGGKDRWSNRNY